MVSDPGLATVVHAGPRPVSRVFWFLNLFGVVLIAFLDWITSGVVVGILLSIPIVLTSAADDRRIILITCAVAMCGFFLAAGYGRGPVTPPSIWVPNRILAFLTMPASCAVALLLQGRRLQAAQARDAAVAANDLTRLLMSLLAHDVRASLAMSVQALTYVQESGSRGEVPDVALARDVQARLQRNLAAIDNLLNLASEELATPDAGAPLNSRVAIDVGAELSAELRVFEAEAGSRRKRLQADFSGLRDSRLVVDPRVLKQAFAILLDNAVRHAVPGAVRVTASKDGGALFVSVEDEGPGLGRSGARAPASGRGLGLALCEALVRRAGGRLDAAGNEHGGTTFTLRLPAGGR